ncbi:hypothetical protein CR513_60932, partial [Mucuna pruriens]
MEFGDTLVQFNIFEAMKHLVEDTSLFGIVLIDEIVEEHMQADTGSTEFFQVVGNTNILDCLESVFEEPDYDEPWEPLSDHLKYAYLGDEKQFAVIIANNLHLEQEEKLNKCLHLHALNLDGGKNTPRKATTKETEPDHPGCSKERNSNWVSPVQVVPKQSGMTVIKIQNDELVPTQVQNSWKVCIDYWKLNQATRKDHFPLPFLDQVLEKLVGKSHYCFLDGYSGYMQIDISLEDQYKTTFTCPFGTFAYTRMSFGFYNAPSTF